MQRLSPLQFALVALLLSNLFTAAYAKQDPKPQGDRRGDIHGGGGNGKAAEFYDMVKHLEKRMAQVGSTVDPEFPLADLSARIPTLEIVPKNGPLLLRGKRVDAINYPAYNVIEFDYPALSSYPLERRYQIVVHEVLGLLKRKDAGYGPSLRLSQATINGLEGALDLNPYFHISRDFNSCTVKAFYDSSKPDDGFLAKITCRGMELFSKKFRHSPSEAPTFLENAEGRLKAQGFNPDGCVHSGIVPNEVYMTSICFFERPGGGDVTVRDPHSP